MENAYIPFSCEIINIIAQTDLEFTFRMVYGGKVKPGQFFEVSIPKYGEAPISVCGIGSDTVDLTIRKAGRVTSEIFTYRKGDKLFMRGPYGNGFDLNNYRNKELIIAAGGTGVAPVKGVIDYFAANLNEVKKLTVIAGFKDKESILFKEDIENWRQRFNLILTTDAEGFVDKYIPDVIIDNIKDVQVITVGPQVMIDACAKAFLQRGVPAGCIWVSHERKMCCGIGKCGHCRINDVYICLDGPVFNYEKAAGMAD